MTQAPAAVFKIPTVSPQLARGVASRMAGPASYRITLDMYVGTTAGVLDRARAATE